MRKITADIVYPIHSEPIEKGVVIIAADGTVEAVTPREQHDPATLEEYAGVLTPGFINAHCHLELSHMKGVAPTGAGLLPFLQTVVNFRDIPEEEIFAAIDRADQEMYDNGIVAVGDISNKLDTAACKDRSALRYYTFVEMFDFLQDSWAERTFNQYKAVYDGHSANERNRKSGVPHAPYTVSRELFRRINELNPAGVTISIHNQETAHENEFFLTKTGGFLEFFRAFNIPIDNFQATGENAIHYALAHLDPDNRTLFVHNTLSGPEDIEAAHRWSDRVYWATCPNANLYIENRLPNYRYFLDANARMTIGTDSLTSNWQLSTLEEMKTIARFQSYVPFPTILRWATLNGAEALGFEDELGSIEPGKKPGLNLIDMTPEQGLQPETRMKRLV